MRDVNLIGKDYTIFSHSLSQFRVVSATNNESGQEEFLAVAILDGCKDFNFNDINFIDLAIFETREKAEEFIKYLSVKMFTSVEINCIYIEDIIENFNDTLEEVEALLEIPPEPSIPIKSVIETPFKSKSIERAENIDREFLAKGIGKTTKIREDFAIDRSKDKRLR